MDDVAEGRTESAPELPPHPRPLRWVIPALGLLLSTALLWQQRSDLQYLLSSATSVDLGRPGAYHLERAAASRYATITGHPGPEVSHYRHALFERDLVPLLEVPVLVDLPHGEVPPRAFGPAGSRDQDRFPREGAASFDGRLEPDVHEPQLREVIRYFIEKDELAAPGVRLQTPHVWVLTVGQRPWHLGWSVLWCLGLLGLVSFNALWLLRRLER